MIVIKVVLMIKLIAIVPLTIFKEGTMHSIVHGIGLLFIANATRPRRRYKVCNIFGQRLNIDGKRIIVLKKCELRLGIDE